MTDFKTLQVFATPCRRIFNRMYQLGLMTITIAGRTTRSFSA